MIGRIGHFNSNLGNIQLGRTVSGIVFNESLSNTLNLTQTIHKSNLKLINISNTLNLISTITGINSKGTHSTLNLTQQLTYIKVHNRSIGNTLALTQTVNKQMIYLRNLRNIITWKPREIQFNNHTIIRPTLIYGKVKKYVTLTTPNRIIVLPPPLFGDKESIKGELKLHKTIGGILYAYGKRTYSRILKYTFQLSRTKGLELSDFCEKYKDLLIKLENWKGEIWYCYIINNPIVFNTVSRISPQRELVSVDLEFDGIRIS